MKKLKLKALELGAMEVLTRSQLKSIMGGDGCTSDADCPPSAYCSNSNGNVCVDRGGSYIIGSGGSGVSGGGSDPTTPASCDATCDPSSQTICSTYDTHCSGNIRYYCVALGLPC